MRGKWVRVATKNTLELRKAYVKDALTLKIRNDALKLLRFERHYYRRYDVPRKRMTVCGGIIFGHDVSRQKYQRCHSQIQIANQSIFLSQDEICKQLLHVVGRSTPDLFALLGPNRRIYYNEPTKIY